jgi:TonB family protein
VKTQVIAILFCAFMACFAARGQQGHDNEVRTHCQILYSQPIKIVRPNYPALARQTKIEGRVSLNCIIGFDGSVEEVKVKKGNALLIQAATDAVSQWKFKPPILNGKAVKTEAHIDIDFQLEKEQ